MLLKHLAQHLGIKKKKNLTKTTRTPRVTTFITKSPPQIQRRLLYVRAPRPIRPSKPETEPEKPKKKFENKSAAIIEAEIAKNAAIADKWWEVDGPHKKLHALTKARVTYIKATLCRYFGRDWSSDRPFEGLKFADVVCGGGLLSEPLARLGATVTGIDAVEKNIQIARRHADLDPTTSSIEYLCTTTEKVVEENRQFDAVLSLGVIEHVESPEKFCKSLSALTVPGGAMVVSTPNRTSLSFGDVEGIQHLLRMLDIDSQDLSRFIAPEILALIFQMESLSEGYLVKTGISMSFCEVEEAILVPRYWFSDGFIDPLDSYDDIVINN